MKKLIKIFSIVICFVLSAVMLAACSEPGAPKYDIGSPTYATGSLANDIKRELTEFLGACKDRTTFQAGEEHAAEYLFERLSDMGYSPEYHNFTTDENKNKGLASRNVYADYKSGTEGANRKTVILGAYYDNRYGESYTHAISFKAEAALAGGSGVATLLAVADYLQKKSVALDFDVKIVFFGASYLYIDGAQAFINSGMTNDERKNTVLMVEMQRLGVDHVYAFTDARETKRESFFDGVAADNGLDIYKITQKSPVITSAYVFDGIPYYQWAFGGVFSVFAQAGIPTLNLVGANWETMNLTDAESASNANISYTDKDTLETLLRLYPDCTNKMAEAATLVIKSLEREDFLSVMQYDRENFPKTDILTKQWVWSLVALGVVLVAAGIVFLVYMHLDKKYKPVVKPPKRLKMAVFGMDYEDKDAADIFIDIRNVHMNDDIFPGIPNNDREEPPVKNNDDEIFPPSDPKDNDDKE